jgi:P27 family predicted phage terminase small subunit
MRGRKPTYTTIQKHGKNENRQAPLAVPRCPALLKGEAKNEWRRMTSLLFDLGIIADLDRTTLAQHCQNWKRWSEAEAAIETQGTIVKSPNGYPIQNPFLSVANQAAKQMQMLLSEFGLSPASRARLLGEKKKTEPQQTGFKGLLANVG